MAFYKIQGISVVVRQTSIGSWEPGIRWHLPVLPTTLARLALRAQARRKEKGCPYISQCHMKLDGLVGTDVSCTSPIYRPSRAFPMKELKSINSTPTTILNWRMLY
jgi:hypothetical protein